MCVLVRAHAFIAQEENFRCYCASLFAVPVSRSTAEPQITTPESCLTIEVLDEVRRAEAIYFNKSVLSVNLGKAKVGVDTLALAHEASQTPAYSFLFYQLIHLFDDTVLFVLLQRVGDTDGDSVAEQRTDNNRK